MSIQILVNDNHERKAFHGGDQVTGIVTAIGPMREEDTTVMIKFKGKSETTIRVNTGQTMRFYNNKAKFFSITKVLFRGPCRLSAGASMSWPFEFSMPATTESDLSSSDIQSSSATSTLFARHAHELPPTISVESTVGRKKARAEITYTLTATATRSAFLSRNLEQTIHLPVTRYCMQSPNDTSSPNPQMTSAQCWFEHASSKLKSPELAQQHRKVGEWFGDKFTSNAPSAAFSLVARTPRVLVVDQAVVPVQLTLKYDSTKSTASVVPDVKLISLEYRLKHYTHVRALNGWGRDETLEPSGFSLIRRLTFGNSPASLLISGETVDLGTSAALSLKGGSVVPTFDTYNIRRYYAVTLHVTVDVVGKQISEKFKWKPVLVLPKRENVSNGLVESSSGVRQSRRDVKEIESQQDSENAWVGEEPAPAYESVVSKEKSVGGR